MIGSNGLNDMTCATDAKCERHVRRWSRFAGASAACHSWMVVNSPVARWPAQVDQAELE